MLADPKLRLAERVRFELTRRLFTPTFDFQDRCRYPEFFGLPLQNTWLVSDRPRQRERRTLSLAGSISSIAVDYSVYPLHANRI